MTPTSIAHYKIVSKLGEGGMGAVYRATDTRLARDVAIKVLPDLYANDPDRVARFVREAQVLASLNHPNIATIFGIEERAIVMELVEGPTLADRITQGALPLDEALPIARQIAEALEAAHEKGIIHRDLKPANVKVTPDGKVKVLDFGLAKLSDPTEAGSDPATAPTVIRGNSPTLAGVILGTAGYMAPEQARGLTVDKRADVWAFGVVLYEMLTGRELHAGGETVADTLAAVITKEPDWAALPASTPHGVRRLLQRCLERDRKKRLRDIGDAWGLMEEPAAAPVVAADVMPTPPRRILPWVIATVVCAAGALGLAFRHFTEAPPAERVLRYSIPAPEKTRSHTFALSPDGRYLAIAAESEGKRQLWVRPLDALAPQPLPGTGDAIYPFWSPDGRNIGFFAEGKLKRIAMDGGPAQVLCDAPSGRGGTWNREDVIVFAPSPGGPLLRVPAVGGVPTAATRIEGANIHRFPLFLPDGRRFLYLATGAATPDQYGVYVASLDSQQVRRVLADQSSVAWLPPAAGSRRGYLLFRRGTTLMAQPFDPQTLQSAGNPFPVAESVGAVNIHNVLASSSANGVLVYGGDGVGLTELGWFDRSGKLLGRVGSPARTDGLALSPDERMLAWSRRRDLGRESDIWLHEMARGIGTRFTIDNSINVAPVWSPDGRRIVFTSTRGGPANLYLKDTSGASQEDALLKSGRSRLPSDWSRDGQYVMYHESGPNDLDLWALKMEGERKPVPYLQTPFREMQGQFSPDGHWVAYASNESGRFEVYVRPFPVGPGERRISNNGGEQPRWRRDGRELFYLASDRKLMAVTVRARPGEQPELETGNPAALFDSHVPPTASSTYQFGYAVAGDGKRFLMNTSEEAPETPLTVVVNWLGAVKK